MAKIFKNNESATLSAGSGNHVKGLTFAAVCQHTTANTAFSDKGFDWDAVNINVVLKNENGGQINILSGKLAPFLMESAYLNDSFRNVDYRTYDHNDATTRVVAASGVKEVMDHYGYIDFGDVINIGKGQSLDVQISMNTPFESTVSTGDSFLEVDFIEGIGVGYSIPVMHSYSISSEQLNPTYDLGDNVTAVTFVNLDKNSDTTAQQVITTATLSSDRKSYQKNYRQLAVERDQIINDTAARNQTFNLHGYEEIDRAKLTLNLDNVAASSNYVIVRTFVTDPSLIASASRKTVKHNQYNRKKFL